MMDNKVQVGLSSIQADDNETSCESGCERLAACYNDSNAHGDSPLQNIRRAYQEASAYFSIVYLDSRRGYGAIANADIPMHTLILDEPPLLPCDALQTALEQHESGLLTCQDDDSRYLRSYFIKQYESLDLGDEMKEVEVQTLIDLFWCMHDQYSLDADGEYIAQHLVNIEPMTLARYTKFYQTQQRATRREYGASITPMRFSMMNRHHQL